MKVQKLQLGMPPSLDPDAVQEHAMQSRAKAADAGAEDHLAVRMAEQPVAVDLGIGPKDA